MSAAAQHGEEREGIRVLGHSSLDGETDLMQVMLKDDIVYAGRPTAERPMLLVDVSKASTPRVVGKFPIYPGTWMPKCQVHGDILLVNYEQRGDLRPEGRAGWGVFDVSNAANPRELAYIDTGGRGVHRIWWVGERYAYISGRPRGFRERMLEIYDMKDPERPTLAGRWWNRGLWEGDAESWPAPARNGKAVHLHHGIYHDGRLYCGFWDGGIIILDVRDPASPRAVGRLEWDAGQGGKSHTALPLPSRRLLVVTDEASAGDHRPKYVRVVDTADETAPREISRWRTEEEIFGRRPGLYGPHNLHENRPGTFRSETLVFATFCNAGLQVIDTSDPARPRRRASFVPAPHPDAPVETNDVLVAADGRIFLADRIAGGLHILEMD